MKQKFVVFTLLFAFWITLSGIFKMKFILVGMIASAVISIFLTPLLYIKWNDRTYFVLNIHKHLFLKYIIWLLKEILLSSLEVCQAVLFPKKYVSPSLVYFKCPFKNPMAIVMLINSIILTPGTVTVDVNEDIFVVHALTENAAKSMQNGGMLMKKIAELYDEEI